MKTYSPTKLSIDALMNAMAAVAEASAQEAAERARYDGYSWGYHGARYIEAVSHAREEAANLLEQYIDFRVNEALERRKAAND